MQITRDEVARRVTRGRCPWALPSVGGALFAATLAANAMPPPRHGAATGVVLVGYGERAALAAMLQADPGLRFLGERLHGSLFYVVYDDPDFPATMRRQGAVAVFNAEIIGCRAGATSGATRASRDQGPNSAGIEGG